VLKHHADELNDWPTPDTKAHLEKHLTRELLSGQDVVLWYLVSVFSLALE